MIIFHMSTIFQKKITPLIISQMANSLADMSTSETLTLFKEIT